MSLDADISVWYECGFICICSCFNITSQLFFVDFSCKLCRSLPIRLFLLNREQNPLTSLPPVHPLHHSLPSPDYSCYQPVHRCVLFQGSKGCVDIRGKGRVASLWHDIWKCPAQLDSHGPPGTAESRVPQVSHQPERGRPARPIRLPKVTLPSVHTQQSQSLTHITVIGRHEGKHY